MLAAVVVGGLGLAGAPAGHATTLTPAAGAAVSLELSAKSWVNAGIGFQLTVTAKDGAGKVATGYRGRVTFTSNDPRVPVLPDDYTFTAADNGSHLFGAALKASGPRTIVATDTSNASIMGSVTTRVSPALFATVEIAAQYSATAGVAFSFKATAKDSYGNRITSFRQAVSFTSSDRLARGLPFTYTFTGADQGAHTFTGIALVSTGFQEIRSVLVADARYRGADTVKVRNAQAAISGQLLSGLDPIVYDATVTVYDAVSGAVLARKTFPGFVDHYRVGGLPAGQIKVGATAPGFAPDFADNVDTLAAGAVFTLHPGVTLEQQWDPISLYLDLQELEE